MIRRAFGSGLAAFGFVGERVACCRVDADDRAVEAGRVAGGADVLARSAPPSAVGGVIAPPRPRRVATGVALIARICVAVLAVVDAVEVRPVAGSRVQRPVRPELDCADRVRRELLAPVLDEHLLGADLRARRGDLDAGEPRAGDAAVGRRSRGGGTGVRVDSRRSPLGCRCRVAEHVVVRVEDVDIRVRREVRVERHPEQPAIPEVVDVRAQVGDDRRRRSRRASRTP